jgi:glutathione synthase/RimK-type ligase-like ATP-grasp enzyme
MNAANLIGDGLYGVDVKQFGDRAVVIEVNDNPSIDEGVEDALLGDELYARILGDFVRRLDEQRA